MYVNVINTPDAEQPRITIKRDTVVKEKSQDKQVTPAELEKEIKERNVISPSPIIVNYEYKYCWSLTWIDTPGLLAPTEKGSSGGVQVYVIRNVLSYLTDSRCLRMRLRRWSPTLPRLPIAFLSLWRR